VSFEHGKSYLDLIELEYSNVAFVNVLEFLNINDKYGQPQLYKYVNKTGTEFNCSATSLRYVYHALLILNHYNKYGDRAIAEVGCGYGGLFLAINYFSRLLKINIEHYYIIDLDPVGKLIDMYLQTHKEHLAIEYSICSASLYGSDIASNNMFLISNYCFTEVSELHRNNYITNLFPKCAYGFIIWQTCFGYSVVNANSVVAVKKIEEERPQTSYNEKNYFVYF